MDINAFRLVQFSMDNLDEPSEPPLRDARSQNRSSMFVTAVMQFGTERCAIRVRNMSPGGAMIESPIIPLVGTNINLLRGALVADGTIIWSSTNRVGVRFTSQISVASWLAAPTKNEQLRVDEMVALVKAGGDSQRGRETAIAPRTQRQMIEDLEAIVDLMKNLEDDLSSSDATLERHGMTLQNIDISMQMLRAVAAELSAESTAVEGLASLKDLRVACAQALGSQKSVPASG